MANEGSTRLEISLVRAWDAAQQQLARGDLLRAVPVKSVGREVHLSVTPERWRGVLIPLRDGEVVSVPKEFRGASSGALRAEVAQFSTGADAANALHVWCRDPISNDAFTSFVVFFLDRLTRESPLGELLGESHAEFERLLGAAASTDSAGLTGLVGELLVLLDGVQLDPRMMDFWAGPRGERHDFRNGNSAIEVKCSLRSDIKAHRVSISDWDQLEVPDGGSLYLHTIRLERVTAGDWSVPKLLAAIRADLDEGGLDVLDEVLKRYDRALIDSPWEFSVKQRDSYCVVDGFPRLVAGMLASQQVRGISAVSYTLDLDHAEPFRTDWHQLLSSFVGRGN